MQHAVLSEGECFGTNLASNTHFYNYNAKGFGMVSPFSCAKPVSFQPVLPGQDPTDRDMFRYVEEKARLAVAKSSQRHSRDSTTLRRNTIFLRALCQSQSII